MTAPVDRGVVREFLTTIAAQAKAALAGVERPGYLQISRVHPADDKLVVVGRYQFDDVEVMIKDTIANAEAGYNAYIEGRTVSERLRGNDRGKLEDTVAVVALVVDNDADKEKAWQPNGAAPSMTVETSPGNRQNWFFPDKAMKVGVASKLGERMRAATDTDQDTGMPTQPYRIAGTPNFPNKAKLGRGRSPTPAPTSILEFDPERLWTLRDLARAFPRPRRAARGAGNGAGGAGGDAPDESAIPADTMRVIRNGVPEGRRSDAFWNITVVLKRLGFTVDGIVSLLERHPDGIAQKYEGRLRHEAQRAYDKVRRPPPAEPIVEPIDLWGQLEPPPLPRGLLPPLIEEFALEVGELMGADPSGLTMSGLAVCAAAIPDRVQIQVKQHDRRWLESARIWVALVGGPSTKKTPIMLRAAEPIYLMDHELFEKYLREVEAYERLENKEKKEHEAPQQRRLRLDDTTIEAATGRAEIQPRRLALLAGRAVGLVRRHGQVRTRKCIAA